MFDNISDEVAFDLVESLPVSKTELLHLIMSLSTVAEGLVDVQRDMADAMQRSGVRLDPAGAVKGITTLVAHGEVDRRVQELRNRLYFATRDLA